MKYSASRKINLGNIDPMFQFETEDLGVHDAESPEEATQKLDAFVRDRILHYREVVMQAKLTKPSPPVTGQVPPTANPPQVFGTPPPFIPSAPPAYGPASPVTTAGPVSGPPAEFGE